MYSVTDSFGSMVFGDRVMRERLPKAVYKKLRDCMDNGTELDPAVATIVANAMKDWAVEKGVTHFTHWFQPMTGITCEKHESFINTQKDGTVVMEFSGENLIKSEPDASSLPSGGLRSTFEARGYTAWDPTSYAFIKDGTLCIPTAFCSYGGEALDKKTPLLRSNDALSKQAVRILHLFGHTDVHRVTSMAGPEQEYFLIDKKMFEARKDLKLTGRTLFGAKSPKGQELDDHYSGAIKPRIKAYMHRLNEELWKLGIPAKTEHNETAPAQHELAVIYSSTNISTDWNQIIMETMRKLAPEFDLTCLLHEKPFAGINGSGKHINWSLQDDFGNNLLEPGSTPSQNAQFLLFLCAILKAVDDYADLLRISAASAANDHRLGAAEAPPAIISVHLGDELTGILEALESGNTYSKEYARELKVGVDVLPPIPKDTTDRNRTSPFCFTGNKFEFRALGSTFSTAGPIFLLNTAVAEVLCQMADELEQADDFTAALQALIQKTIKDHSRIVFNGNGYSNDWVVEAQKRGLLNLRTTPQALPHFIAEKNEALFEKHDVLSKAELHSRYEILLENYCKVLGIESMTMLDIVRKDIIPAVTSYIGELTTTALSKKQLSDAIPVDMETKLITRLSALTCGLSDKADQLDMALLGVKNCETSLEKAQYYRSDVFSKMQEVRAIADELELNVSKKYWPFPTYADLLFSVT